MKYQVKGTRYRSFPGIVHVYKCPNCLQRVKTFEVSEKMFARMAEHERALIEKRIRDKVNSLKILSQEQRKALCSRCQHHVMSLDHLYNERGKEDLRAV